MAVLIGGVVTVSLLAAAVVGAWTWSRQDVAAAALGPPHFLDEAMAAGIDHSYEGDWTFFVGGGMAVFDCDDDRKPDLYFAGGASTAALYRNQSPLGGTLRFDHLRDPSTDLTSVTGAYPLDIDADQRTDLAVLRLGENVLLRGLGDCRFERANEAWGYDGGSDWTVGFSAKWEASAGLPTLAFGDYVALDESGQNTGTCSDGELVRPAASGGYAAPIALAPGRCTLSMLFSDWDRSGRADLRMTNDRHYDAQGEEQLWQVADGQAPRLYTREEGWARLAIWGMGIASQDLTGDGHPEVFLTSQGDNKLQTLADGPGQPTYRDIAIRRGVTAHRPFTGGDVMPSTAWHAEFDDLNSDGFMDLFIAKGNVEAMAEYATLDPSNLLLGQPDGIFVESAEAAGVLSYARGRGGAVVDLNLDGMLDLVKVNRRENVELWRSVGAGDAERPAPMGDWVAVDLEQTGPNPDAIGAWIEVDIDGRITQRERTVGGGHAGGELGWIHFGVGDADSIRIRVRWPDGEAGPWSTLGVNRFAIVERGAVAPHEWVAQ
ncbi:MAG: CRTAC1 family protein [Chloroflexi bacterium]|nr:CRTAC1 family protein [Chloroflexota bacterium]